MARWAHGAGSVIAGKYRITGTLGQGGMGSVYEAVNDAVGKRVALKVLNANLADHPDFARRFELEARAAGLINHPGIVDVLDFGRADDGSPYMVMEHLTGLSVRGLQKAIGPFSPALAAAVVLPALDALSAAHAAGVVHRDLKTANLFLSTSPRAVKILDFGISKFSTVGQGMTHTGTTLGTPAFMAPEQLKDGRAAGPASDLYAMGAVLYSLLTGHPPFEADSDFALVARVLTQPHRPLAELLPGLPEGLAALIDQQLAKDPQQRAPTAAALREALAAVVSPDTEGLFALAEQHVEKAAPAPALLATPLPPQGPATATETTPGTPRALEARQPGAAPPAPRRWPLAAGFVALMAVGAGGAVLALKAAEQALRAPATLEDFAPSMEKARALAADGGLSEALALLDGEIRSAERASDKRREAFAARNRGNFAHDQGSCAESGAYFLRALKLFERAGDRAGVGLLANDLGMLGLDCPDIDRVTWFKLATRVRWEVKDLAGVRKSANNLGVAYLHAKDYEAAEGAYNEALIAATELGDKPAIMKIKSNLSFIWALIADGPAIRDGGTSFDKSSLAWKKARFNFLQSMDVARDAGLSAADVCHGWEQYKEICLHMGE